MAAQVTLPRDILSIDYFIENRLPKEVLRNETLTCHLQGLHVNTMLPIGFFKKTFYNWELEIQELDKTGHVFSEKDLFKSKVY